MLNFEYIVDKLGVTDYPINLPFVYFTVERKDDSFCPPEYIAELQEKYGLLGEYAQLVIKAAEEVYARPELNAWGWICSSYNKYANIHESQMLHMPKSDGTLAMDMLPVLILLCDIPDAVRRYESRGFTATEIKKNLTNIRINIWVNEILYKRPMLTDGYYSWLRLYVHAHIFDHEAFNFQPAVWGTSAIYLKNKKTGDVYPMMTSGKFHKSGLVLGSEGALETEESFDAEFKEYPDLFVGHLAVDGKVESKLSMLKRSEWECILRSGEDVLSLHIPRSADLTPNYVTRCIKEGIELTKKHYPELNPKFVVCYSWLLDPQLEKILDKDSKIASFTRRFNKHPINDPSLCCLGYIFPGQQSAPVATFPEDTTLQRGAKRLMLEGGFIRGTAGIITELDKQ